MKAKDAGPMYQDWRVQNVPGDLVRRLRAAIAADGLTMREWFEDAAARTVAEYEAKMKGGKAAGK